MEDKQNIHQGHRKRMLEQYLKNGIDAFTDVEVLEFLLSYGIPRKDTNPVAHRLLDDIGSLHQVLDAPLPQLLQVEGVGERSAALICFCRELWKRSEESRVRNEKYFRTTREVGRFLMARIGRNREERAYLMCLDGACRLLDFRQLSIGSVSEVNLPLRRVVEAALSANAVSVVLAHNHTNGSAVPSGEDIIYTNKLLKTLLPLGVILSDHIVVSDYSYTSMKCSGMLLKEKLEFK